MIYYSTENLSTETMDRETRDRILSLSYEKFFQDSISLEKDITYLNRSIEDANKNYVFVANSYKDKFRSTEDAAVKADTKGRFFANIRNWFIRIWAAIVTIFEKIVAVIQSLIKTLILYIRKHALLKNSIYSKLKSPKNLSISFDALDPNVTKNINKLFNSKHGFMVHATAFSDRDEGLSFSDTCEMLKNPTLISFIKTKVIVDNKKSAINTEHLKMMMDNIEASQASEELDADRKLSDLSDAITDFASQTVLYGEADRLGKLYSVYGETSDAQVEILGALQNGNIKDAANMIVYNNKYPERIAVTLRHFMEIPDDIQAEDVILAKLRELLAKYEYTSNIVIGKGGYCDIIEDVLKKYSVAANNDKKTIKSIKDKIIKSIQDLDGNGPSDTKVAHKCKRFTNIIVRIQKLKNDFILLRQYVLGNILTLYSSLDKSLACVFDPKNHELEQRLEEDDIGNRPFGSVFVGGKDGENPLEGFYDEDDPISAQDQLDRYGEG